MVVIMRVSNFVAGAVFFTGLACVSSGAMAEGLKSSITAGYAQSELSYENLSVDGHPQGLNVKGRFEFDDTWGLISSYTHTQKSYDSINLFYNSLTVGPTVRVNDYASLYALIGAAWGEAEARNDSTKKTDIVGGTGIQLNPIPNLVLDASYEYSKLGDFKVGTWVIGAGARF